MMNCDACHSLSITQQFYFNITVFSLHLVTKPQLSENAVCAVNGNSWQQSIKTIHTMGSQQLCVRVRYCTNLLTATLFSI